MKARENCEPNEDCYLIIDRKAIDALSKYLSCKKCGSGIEFSVKASYGLAFDLQIQCEKCHDIGAVPSSRSVENRRQKDVNLRATLALRMLAKVRLDFAPYVVL